MAREAENDKNECIVNLEAHGGARVQLLVGKGGRDIGELRIGSLE